MRKRFLDPASWVRGQPLEYGLEVATRILAAEVRRLNPVSPGLACTQARTSLALLSDVPPLRLESPRAALTIDRHLSRIVGASTMARFRDLSRSIGCSGHRHHPRRSLLAVAGATKGTSASDGRSPCHYERSPSFFCHHDPARAVLSLSSSDLWCPLAAPRSRKGCLLAHLLRPLSAGLTCPLFEAHRLFGPIALA